MKGSIVKLHYYVLAIGCIFVMGNEWERHDGLPEWEVDTNWHYSATTGIELHKGQLFNIDDMLPQITEDDIIFEYEIQKVNNSIFGQNQLLLHGSLLNTTKDTLYYLCSSCYGHKSNMEIAPRLLCNASKWLKLKISPDSRHNFVENVYPRKGGYRNLTFLFRQVSAETEDVYFLGGLPQPLRLIGREKINNNLIDYPRSSCIVIDSSF